MRQTIKRTNNRETKMTLKLTPQLCVVIGITMGGILSFLDPWLAFLGGIALSILFSYDFNKDKIPSIRIDG